jgi:hypothetical protein
MMPFFISKKELDILEQDLEPKSYVDEAGAKIESYSVHIRNDN